MLRATGKDWSAWVAALNRASAGKISHREIIRLVHERFGLPAWWSQMVTVGHEQATGRREKHQQMDGFEASAGRIVGVSAAELNTAWYDTMRFARWLPAPVTIRKATPRKSMRIAWRDDTTLLAVMFYPKGAGKAQVTVQHGKLPPGRGRTGVDVLSRSP